MPKNNSGKAFFEFDTTYQIYYNMLKNIALSNIRWDGVPEEIDLRYVELAFYRLGRCLFFADEELNGYVWLEYMENGMIDIYNNPTGFTVSTPSGYFRNDLTTQNSVPVYCNMTRTPEFRIVDWYARKLALLVQKIDMNIDVCTNPALVIAPEEMEFSIKNAIKKKEEGVPVIISKRGFENVEFAMMGVEAQKNFIADDLKLMFEKLWNEALTFLGVSNLSVTKKERLITDEVQRSQGGTLASRNSRLLMRQYGAEQINKLFGLDLQVSFRDIFQGGESYEFLYDTTSVSTGKNGRIHGDTE